MHNRNRSRYQFYLDDAVIKSLAKMSKDLDISRSQLVRDALESSVEIYTVKAKNKRNKNYSKLLELLGIIQTDKQDLSTRINEIYFIDQIKEKHGLS